MLSITSLKVGATYHVLFLFCESVNQLERPIESSLVVQRINRESWGASGLDRQGYLYTRIKFHTLWSLPSQI